MQSNTSRDFVVALIGAVIGGVLVALTTAYIDKSARLSAIEMSRDQVEELTNKVVELRVEAELASKQVMESKQLVEDKSEQIDRIAEGIIKRQETISKLDIISAFDQKISEFESIGQEMVVKNIQQFLPSWRPVSGNNEFNNTCMYKFDLNGHIDYFTEVNSHWVRGRNTASRGMASMSSVKSSSPNTLIFTQFRPNEEFVLEHQGQLYELCFN